MGRRPEETFFFFHKEDIQMANRYTKKFSTSLNHQRNTNQNHSEYHLTPIRMSITEKTTNNKWQKGV